jgi:hypothetical protein
MYEGKASAAVALLAGIGLVTAAGCSSSPGAGSPSASSSSSSSAAASTPTASSGALPAADCTVIKPIAASAVSKLTPLAHESKAKAAAGITSYIAQLQTAGSKLTSAQAKADINSLITALEKSPAETQAQATAAITAALTKLGAACP